MLGPLAGFVNSAWQAQEVCGVQKMHAKLLDAGIDILRMPNGIEKLPALA